MEETGSKPTEKYLRIYVFRPGCLMGEDRGGSSSAPTEGGGGVDTQGGL